MNAGDRVKCVNVNYTWHGREGIAKRKYMSTPGWWEFHFDGMSESETIPLPESDVIVLKPAEDLPQPNDRVRIDPHCSSQYAGWYGYILGTTGWGIFYKVHLDGTDAGDYMPMMPRFVLKVPANEGKAVRCEQYDPPAHWNTVALNVFLDMLWNCRDMWLYEKWDALSI